MLEDAIVRYTAGMSPPLVAHHDGGRVAYEVRRRLDGAELCCCVIKVDFGPDGAFASSSAAISSFEDVTMSGSSAGRWAVAGVLPEATESARVIDDRGGRWPTKTGGGVFLAVARATEPTTFSLVTLAADGSRSERRLFDVEPTPSWWFDGPLPPVGEDDPVWGIEFAVFVEHPDAFVAEWESRTSLWDESGELPIRERTLKRQDGGVVANAVLDVVGSTLDHAVVRGFRALEAWSDHHYHGWAIDVWPAGAEDDVRIR